jgi:hypothetical protein
MGLDMYLTGKRYMSAWVDADDAEKQAAIQRLFPELAEMRSHFEGSPVKEIRVDAGCWRKANAIHDWFVQNVQDGEDACEPHAVSRAQLAELRSLCERTIAARSGPDGELTAQDLLPTANGFFFGSTDYSDWYYEQLAQTVAIIDRCLALPPSWDFEYCSSW